MPKNGPELIRSAIGILHLAREVDPRFEVDIACSIFMLTEALRAGQSVTSTPSELGLADSEKADSKPKGKRAKRQPRNSDGGFEHYHD
jgi:hypothetical protein